MWRQDSDDPFQIGTFVKIRNSGYKKRAKVIEYCGTLGPNGAKIYRLLVRRRPPAYTEVRADQLELWSKP